VRRLDSVVPELEALGMTNGIYLKVDTQGFDMQVIEGAGVLLDRIRALQTESAVFGVYEGCPDFLATIPAIRARGYDVSGFFPVASDDRLWLIEFDCVMVNSAWHPGSLESA
jgi:methyltransferase FkbM-like protein